VLVNKPKAMRVLHELNESRPQSDGGTLESVILWNVWFTLWNNVWLYVIVTGKHATEVLVSCSKIVVLNATESQFRQ